MKAIKENKVNIFNILSKCDRVDLNQKDKAGNDLITIARNSGNVDMVVELRVGAIVRENRELRNVKERHVNFLLNFIKEKESELECPVCLVTAGGEIFSCVQQHLVCSNCKPR